MIENFVSNDRPAIELAGFSFGACECYTPLQSERSAAR